MNNNHPIQSSIQPKQPAFKIGEVISSSWRNVHGFKVPFWAIGIWIIIIYILFYLASAKLNAFSNPHIIYDYRYIVLALIQIIISAPFIGCAVGVAIKKARQENISYKTGYGFFNRSLAVIITLLIIAILTNISSYIVNLPAIEHYGHRLFLLLTFITFIISVVIYSFTVLSVPLVVDRNYSPLRALAQSFKLMSHCWLRAIGVFIVAGLCFVLALIPIIPGLVMHTLHRASAGLVLLIGQIIFLIALIWLFPFIFLIQAELYRRVAK